MSDDFTSRTLRALAEAADERRTQMLAEDLGQLPAPPLSRWARLRRLFNPTTLGAALVGATLALLVSTLASPSSPTPSNDRPVALDGGLRDLSLPPQSTWEALDDGTGRLAELRPRKTSSTGPTESDTTDGQRLLFRAECLARIETYRAGKLHGPTLEFDLRGQLVSIRRFVDGLEAGPPVRLDSDGGFRDSP